MDTRTIWIMIQFGFIVFAAGGAFFTLRQLRREVSAIWLKLDKHTGAQRTVNTKTLLALQTLAAGNPKPNQRALKLCDEIASINGKD